MNSRESLSPSHNLGGGVFVAFPHFCQGGLCFSPYSEGIFFRNPIHRKKRKENEMQLYDVNRQIEELLARLESDPETG